MNISRIALLSAVVFVSPVFCEDTTAAANQTQQPPVQQTATATSTSDASANQTQQQVTPPAQTTPQAPQQATPPTADTTTTGNTAPQADQKPAAEATGFFANAKWAIMFPFVLALQKYPNFVANHTITPALNKIAGLSSYLNFLSVKEDNMGARLAVLAITAVAIYKAIEMYNADDATDTNDDFFTEENN